MTSVSQSEPTSRHHLVSLAVPANSSNEVLHKRLSDGGVFVCVYATAVIPDARATKLLEEQSASLRQLADALERSAGAEFAPPPVEPTAAPFLEDGELYPDLRPWDLEPHYSRHVQATTEESLVSKSQIAMQLAWRDQRVAKLESEVLHAERQIARLQIGLRDGLGAPGGPIESDLLTAIDMLSLADMEIVRLNGEVAKLEAKLVTSRAAMGPTGTPPPPLPEDAAHHDSDCLEDV